MAENLRITELDFEEIKTNLKTYMSSRPEFSDYNFEGSGLSFLIDVLSYNTHYNAILANFNANEAYLISALIRGNVVSKAREGGYTPRSRRAPVAVVTVTATPSPTSTAFDAKTSVTLEKGKVFSVVVEGNTYEFVTNKSYTLTKNESGQFTASGVEIYQGRLLSFNWTVDSTDPDQRFVIPNEGVDETTLLVNVQNSETDLTTTTFSRDSEFFSNKSSNAAYWLWETQEGLYELEFGDGILGKKLVDGNIVTVDYIATKGDEANSASVFNFTTSIQGLTDVEVTTEQVAYGGAERESIEEIKYNAPRRRRTGNRAVIEEDYEDIIIRDFPYIRSVSTWGGEKNDPPIAGKVFISINPVEGLEITQSIKERIKDEIIDSYNIVAVVPEIVDPDYLYIELTTRATYDAVSSSKSDADYESEIAAVIEAFKSSNSGFFNRGFVHADLVCNIKDIDDFVQSVLIDVLLRRSLSVSVGITGTYSTSMLNSLQRGTVEVSGLYLTEDVAVEVGTTYELRDTNSDGILYAYRIDPDGNEHLLGNYGSVDYSTGDISLTQISIESTDSIDNEVTIKAIPVDEDIATGTNNIIVIDTDNSTIEAVAKNG